MKTPTISRYIRAYMTFQEKTQQNMADLLGMTQQGFGKKLLRGQFTYDELVRIFRFLKVPDEKIVEIMRCES